LDLDERRLARRSGTLERGLELFGLGHRLAMAAMGAGERGEVGVDQIGGDGAAGIVALLMHADGAVDAIVDDHHDYRRAILHGGRDFLAGQLEAPVAGEGHYRALGMSELRRDRRGQAVAHRAGGWRELRAVAAEPVEAVDPAGIVAGTIGDDRVFPES